MSSFSTIEDLKITEEDIIPFPESDELQYISIIALVSRSNYIMSLLVAMSNAEGGCLVFGAKKIKDNALLIGLDDNDFQRFKLFEKNHLFFFRWEYVGGLEVSFDSYEINGKRLGVVFIGKAKRKILKTKNLLVPKIQDGIIVFENDPLAIDEQTLKEIDVRLHTCFVGIDNYDSYKGMTNYWILKNQIRWQILYKYMTLDSFIRCIESGNLMFQEPNGWNDQFERRFYKADYSDITSHPEDTPKFYATCLTQKKDNEAAWKTYSSGIGLGARCVQLKLDAKKFREEIARSSAMGYTECDGGHNGNMIKCRVYEGKVSYRLTENEIMHLHENRSVLYPSFFDFFTLDCFLGLHLYKRPAFDYEDEVRFFMVPYNWEERTLKAQKSKRLFVKIDWRNIIQEVRIDSKCSVSELIALKTICHQKGIELKENVSRKPLQNLDGTSTIRLEKYDVDRMRGTKRIKIDKP